MNEHSFIFFSKHCVSWRHFLKTWLKTTSVFSTADARGPLRRPVRQRGDEGIRPGTLSGDGGG